MVNQELKKEKVDLIPAYMTWPLRRQIILPHLKDDKDCQFTNDEETSTFHLGAFWENQLIGVGSFYAEIHESIPFVNSNPYHLRMLGIKEDYCRKGLGRKIIETAWTYLQLRGSELLWCQTPKKAAPFFLKMGFNYFGNEFVTPDRGTQHLMLLEIAPLF